MKQIGIAFHNFSDAFQALPDSIRPPAPQPRFSWETKVLPFIDQQALYAKIDQTANWSSNIVGTGFAQPNWLAAYTRIPSFECPSSPVDLTRYDDDPDSSNSTANGLTGNYNVALAQAIPPDILFGYANGTITAPPSSGGTAATAGRFAAPTDYSTIVEVETALQNITDSAGNPAVDYYTTTGTAAGTKLVANGIIPKNSRAKFDDVKDGLSNTILVAESGGRPHVWQRPANRLVDITGTNEFGGWATGGTEGVASGSGYVAFTNGGGWARPASDIALLGSSADGKTLPGLYINRTNGWDVSGLSWTPTTGFAKTLSALGSNSTLAGGTGTVEGGTGGSGQPFSFHSNGLQIVLADGSVKFINENIPIRLFARLVTRDQGESVDASFYEVFQFSR